MHLVSPERGFVVVELVKDDPLQQSKIINPDTARQQPQMGRVLSVGQNMIKDGQELPSGDFQVDDLVYFGKWMGLEFRMNGKDHKIIKQDDVYAVINLDKKEATI